MTRSAAAPSSSNSKSDQLRRVNLTLPVRILEYLFEERARRRNGNTGNGSRMSYGAIITDIIDDWRADKQRPPKRPPAKSHAASHRRVASR
jgi:hypothetical protein